MRINNNDLIQEAMKRCGLEVDKPFKIKSSNGVYSWMSYGNSKERVTVFKISKVDNEYIIHDANYIKNIFCGIGELLFDFNVEFELIENKEYKPIDIKSRAEKLYCKYIKLAKEYNNNNNIEPTDFIGGAFESNKIISKLEVLSDILGYDYRKVSNDIKGN